jgi:hypothetical protein
MRENDKLRELLNVIEQELTDLERRLPDGPRFACLDELRRVLGDRASRLQSPCITVERDWNPR